MSIKILYSTDDNKTFVSKLEAEKHESLLIAADKIGNVLTEMQIVWDKPTTSAIVERYSVIMSILTEYKSNVEFLRKIMSNF